MVAQYSHVKNFGGCSMLCLLCAHDDASEGTSATLGLLASASHIIIISIGEESRKA